MVNKQNLNVINLCSHVTPVWLHFNKSFTLPFLSKRLWLTVVKALNALKLIGVHKAYIEAYIQNVAFKFAFRTQPQHCKQFFICLLELIFTKRNNTSLNESDNLQQLKFLLIIRWKRFLWRLQNILISFLVYFCDDTSCTPIGSV